MGQKKGDIKGLRYDHETHRLVSTKENYVPQETTVNEESIKHIINNLDDTSLVGIIKLTKDRDSHVRIDAYKMLMAYNEKQSTNKKYREMSYKELKEELTRELRELRRLEKKPSSEVFVGSEGIEEESVIRGDVEIPAAGETTEVPQFDEADTVCDRGEPVGKDDESC